jgi:hypothetical protein
MIEYWYAGGVVLFLVLAGLMHDSEKECFEDLMKDWILAFLWPAFALSTIGQGIRRLFTKEA